MRRKPVASMGKQKKKEKKKQSRNKKERKKNQQKLGRRLVLRGLSFGIGSIGLLSHPSSNCLASSYGLPITSLQDKNKRKKKSPP